MAPADRLAAGTQEGNAMTPRASTSWTREPARPDGREDGASRPQPGAWPGGSGGFPSLLSEDAPGPQGTGEQDGDNSFARDLNLDQIVAAVAGDREERDLVTRVFTPACVRPTRCATGRRFSGTWRSLPCWTRCSASPTGSARYAPTCVSWTRCG